MFPLDDLFSRQPNERVYKVLRRHALTLWPRLFVPASLIAVPFFFLFHLTVWYRVLLFIFVEAIGWVMAIRTFLIWDGSVLVITSHRLCQVDRQGFWQRSVLDTPLQFVNRVEATRLRISPFFFCYGSLNVYASGSEQPITVRAIGKSGSVKKLIQEILERKAWQRTVAGESGDVMTDIQNAMDQSTEANLHDVKNLLEMQKTSETKDLGLEESP